jgi:predicted  nucleic acid-binding Zn-ribbon protein
MIIVQEAIGDKNKNIADLNAELTNWKSNGAASEARLRSAEEQLTEKNKALELKTAEVRHRLVGLEIIKIVYSVTRRQVPS